MYVDVKAEVLTWACKYAQVNSSGLTKRFPNYGKWITGEKKPTIHQLEQLAHYLHIPFGYLLLDEVPQIVTDVVHDFRTLRNKGVESHQYSPELRDTISIMKERQAWLHDYKIENGYDKVRFIGTISQNQLDATAVKRVLSELGLPVMWQEDIPKKTSAINYFIDKIEQAGVIVFINSMVGNNTTRLLNAEEFRGFALVDNYAPLIFINGADTPAARLFTLVHELIHLFLGRDGLDDGTEAYCNRIAAQLLVPKETFLKKWKDNDGDYGKLKAYFRVSLLVIYRVALTYGVITKDEWKRLHFCFVKAYEDKHSNANSKPDFYKGLPNKIGKRFSYYVFHAVREESLMYTDAYHLLGIKGDTFKNAYQKAGV